MGKPAGKKSAYTFFVQAEKEIWQKNNPDQKIAFGDFMKECGAKWKTLDEDAKEPFAVKAAADAKRYEAEMVDYVPEAGERGGKKRKVKVNVSLINWELTFNTEGSKRPKKTPDRLFPLRRRLPRRSASQFARGQHCWRSCQGAWSPLG